MAHRNNTLRWHIIWSLNWINTIYSSYLVGITTADIGMKYIIDQYEPIYITNKHRMVTNHMDIKLCGTSQILEILEISNPSYAMMQTDSPSQLVESNIYR